MVKVPMVYGEAFHQQNKTFDWSFRDWIYCYGNCLVYESPEQTSSVNVM